MELEEDHIEDTHSPLAIHFRLLYNWTQGLDQDPLLQHKVNMYAAFQVELNQIPIYRLVDHSLAMIGLQTNQQFTGEHWVSAGQLWKACGLTLTEGLFLFQLSNAQYQLDFLEPPHHRSFPFQDVWVTLTMARSMATTLGVMSSLAWFLDVPTLSQVYSSDHPERQEMVHNWRIIGIPYTSYSTRALLDYPLKGPEELDIMTLHHHHQQQQQYEQQKPWRTTTQTTRYQYQPGIVMKDRAETGLVRWQVWAYEHFLTSNKDDALGNYHHYNDGKISTTGKSSSQSVGSGNQQRRRPWKSDYGNKDRRRWRNSIGNDAIMMDDEDDTLFDNKGTTTTKQINDSDDDNLLPTNAVWDVLQGLLCDVQSLKRLQEQRQQHHMDDNTTTTAEQSLRGSRLFSDSMMIGNMPLKSDFLHQSASLQHIYLSVMMEKIYNAMDQLYTTTRKSSQGDLVIPSSAPIATTTLQRPTTTSVSTTTVSDRTNNNQRLIPQHTSQLDPHMMLHDRMDLLEQELYRVKKKAKKKMDEADLKWMELQHQWITLDNWKRALETRRKTERAWMLLIILLLCFVLWIFLY